MRGRQGERGSTAIEMTVLLPFLVILLFGIIETSVMLYDQAMITNAAREGARFGILFNVDGDGTYTPMSTAQIEAVVNDYLADRLISFAPADAQIVVNGGGASGTSLTVRVEYVYTFMILPNLAQSITNPLNLSAEATMRME